MGATAIVSWPRSCRSACLCACIPPAPTYVHLTLPSKQKLGGLSGRLLRPKMGEGGGGRRSKQGGHDSDVEDGEGSQALLPGKPLSGSSKARRGGSGGGWEQSESP